MPYQKAWAEDDSRFKIGLQARQTGKDYASGEEGIADCYKHELEGSKVDWLLAAPSERQSLESLEKWKQWTEAYKLAIDDFIEEREGGSETLLKSATIVFPHGSRVMAVPGKPDTVRGYSCNFLLTEAAFFEDFDATWRAIYPSINNPLRGGVKKGRLISTPNGVGNKFHEIWQKNYGKSDQEVKKQAESIIPVHVRERIDAVVAGLPKTTKLTSQEAQMRWSCHLVTIYDAVAQGLPVNLYELYAGMDDPEGWAQEFECQFLDSQAVLLPYELIAGCESLEATATMSPEFWMARSGPPIDIGIDFGRKHDLTVAWSNLQLGDIQQTCEVLELKAMSTPDQVEILSPRIQRARRVCLDYTGPGIGMGDYLVKAFGEWKPDANKFGKIELCTFTNLLKVELFSKMRMAFERRSNRIPILRSIREDLHSVNRVTTPGGAVTYRASHNADGHADRATALALSIRAGSYGLGAALTTTEGIILGNNHAGMASFRPRHLVRQTLKS